MTNNKQNNNPDEPVNAGANGKPDEGCTPTKPEELYGENVAGIWVVSGEDMPALSNIQDTQGDYIIAGGILGKQEKAMTYSHPKYLKTMVEIWKGMCIATGQYYFDYEVKQGRVLYIGMEDTLPKLSNRVTKMKAHFPPIGEFKFTVLPTGMRNIEYIETLIHHYKPQVTIIDPLTHLLKREDKKEDVETLLKQLDVLIERYGISIVIIHHARKGRGETIESMRGSSALPGWLDTVCQIERRDNNKDKIVLKFESRHAHEELEDLKLNFRRDDCFFEVDMTKSDELQNLIRYELLAKGPMPLSQLIEKFGGEASARTIQRAIKAMPDVVVEFDPNDRRRRMVKLNPQSYPSTRGLQS